MVAYDTENEVQELTCKVRRLLEGAAYLTLHPQEALVEVVKLLREADPEVRTCVSRLFFHRGEK